ncbi:MAG: carbohydrate ABC transporter permease [Rectinemataceae bacterium]
MRKAGAKDEILYQIAVNLYLAVIFLIVLLPLWRVLMLSLTPFGHLDNSFGLLVGPKDWTFDAYAQFLSHPAFLRAMRNSAVITLGGTAINLIMTVPMSYALSVKSLPGRKWLNIFVMIPFLFNAGLIPSYLVVTSLGLQNTLWAVMIPGAIGISNMFIMRNFFMEIPQDLTEAARIDGASELKILFRIVLPLSKPILLTIGLFYAVGHWNEFFNPMLYLNDQKLQPLPVLLRNILMGVNMNDYVEYDAFSTSSVQSLKAASIFISMVPMMMAYPWIQKHFVKGSLAGGIKG